MNIKFYLLFFIASFTVSNAQVTITPAVFNVTDAITITVSTAAQSCNGIAASSPKIYMHAGIGDDNNAFAFNVVGNWGQDDGIGQLTNNGNGTWSITLTPSTYFNLTPAQQANATKLGMVFRNANGSQELKKPQTPSGCGDFIFNVGTFQLNLTAPVNNSATIMNSGGSLNIAANNTGGNASYTLTANGTLLNSNAATNTYAFTHSNITANTNYVLEATLDGSTITRTFSVIINPGVISEALPSGLQDGINYNSSDATRATLVLDAPGKDFVYVAGSFNNYQPSAAYAMKKDPSSTKFWVEITGLNPGEAYNYQYWMVDQTPIAGSPVMVKAADPYSTLVLSPFDDQWIPATTYPNMPAYPANQNFEVTVLQTGQTPYNWQVTNFTKPEKDKLVVYEVLIRDFDSDRNYQDLIDKIQYFKDLGINAIELMPVMEFEGNESWGYNTAFHMALDKFYGTGDKLKAFVDLCHQNGIAVILDVALNHAFGRNPMVRMWMNDPDGNGYGDPAADSPYFNQIATHSYSVGSDFNHQQPRTKNYVKRVVKHWIEEYKIDGFRWDLTKGFTQNCTNNDGCTNSYQQDRVDVLKEYADYSWSLDPNHYVIFEHLGPDNEEQQWANYRLNEGKGIMMWGELFHPYKQLAQGYATDGDITRMGHVSHGFSGKRLMGYAESHDKDRLMYEAVTYGNAAGAFPVQNNLPNALKRMSSIGAISLLIPGPKMIWHFQELGMDDSIYTCTAGGVNPENDANPGDCKLETKPQPQWAENWTADPLRSVIFDNYARFIDLKLNEPVFNGDYTISTDGNNVRQRIYVYKNDLPVTQLKNVVIIANFSVAAQNINPNFPYAGTWYNLMDNTVVNVANVTTPISVPSGEFRIYGNQQALLDKDEFNQVKVALYPNPSTSFFQINRPAKNVSIYAITGQLVKEFNGNLERDHSYGVEEMNQGIYLVKITDENNNQSAVKLIKR